MICMQREYSILRNKHTAKLINSSLQCNCASTSLIVLITSIKMELGRWLIHACTISIVLLLRINASLSLGHHHANMTARCIERERDALLAIKGDLVDEYNLLSSWGREDCCGWERVHCDPHTGHVIQLHLGGVLEVSRRGLDRLEMYNARSGYMYFPGLFYLQGQDILKNFGGQVSPKIIELQYLEYLDLSLNFFNATQIPTLICSLSNLRHLDLHSNHLTGSKIPKLIGNLTNLRYLDLSYIGFSGEIPTTMCSLSNLRHLDLYDNDLNGSNILELIGNLTNLRYLDLSENSLGDETPVPYHQLGNLTHLQYLNLGYTYHTHVVENLNWLPRLSSLKYLDLSWTNLSKVSDWLDTVNKLPNLKNLTLYECDLPPPILSTLSHINSSNSLVHVDLSGNVITSSIFKWLCNYNTTLAYLDLSFTQLSGLIPDVFINMRSLKSLYLIVNQLSVSITSHVFKTMSSLEHLSLSYNQLSVLNPNAFTNMSSLAFLDLSSNRLSGLNPNAFSNMSSLAYLDLSSNRLSGLNPNAFSNMSSLAYLDLSSNRLSGLNPNVFANMSSLAYLDLSSNRLSGLNSNAFANMSSLAYLSLSDNSLEGEIPTSIAQLCSLQHLFMSGCNLTGQLSEFVQRWSACPQNPIRSLYLSNNDLVGSFPDFTNFSSLESLDLSGNKLSGMVPDSIGKLSSLTYLSVDENQLRWTIPESIGELSRLYYLSLSGNLLSGRIPESIGKLSSLAHLDLSKNQLSGRIPDSIAQLSMLTYLNLQENLLSRKIPEQIGKMSSLEILDLSRNWLRERIPQSIGQLSSLRSINLSVNHLEGEISEIHFTKLSILDSLDLSYNSRLEFNVSSNWIPPFNLSHLSLRFFKAGPNFPKWLQTQKGLFDIDMSFANISDVLPSWFWGVFGGTRTIDFSNNKIRGTLGSSKIVSFSGFEVRISSNRLDGLVPSFLSNASYLDLSDNKFSEMTSFLCSSNVKVLKFLNLSKNHIAGEVPDCWRHWANLQLLDLSFNAFSGKIPPSIGYIHGIKTLKLRRNKLVGELPSSLKNCTSLNVIDLGNNQLSSSVPDWIGASLPDLVILMLQFNQLSGSLPSQLCHLPHLQILDVSVNEISGTIPKCLNNLTSLAQEGNSNLTIRHSFNISQAEPPMTSLYYDDDATFMWKGTLASY
uniref:probable leucine-rich repeat receptor-like protein kinase At1g35710 n=1 Tax=Fragaria vesca subsp. vesca TaxID=101020 RepID=UPI0005C9C710